MTTIKNKIVGLLDIIREQCVIEKLQRYKKTKLKFHTIDETSYHLYIRFSDSEDISAKILASSDIEVCFIAFPKSIAIHTILLIQQMVR